MRYSKAASTASRSVWVREYGSSAAAQTRRASPRSLRTSPSSKISPQMRSPFCGEEEFVEPLVNDVGRPRRHSELDRVFVFVLGAEFVVELGEEKFEEFIEGVDAGIGKGVVFQTL